MSQTGCTATSLIPPHHIIPAAGWEVLPSQESKATAVEKRLKEKINRIIVCTANMPKKLLIRYYLTISILKRLRFDKKISKN